MLHYATISFSQLDWPSSNINNIQFVAPDKWRTWGPHSGTRGCLELHQRGGERINIWNSLSELKYKTNIKWYFILSSSPTTNNSPVNNHYSSTGFIKIIINRGGGFRIPALLVAACSRCFANKGDRAEHFSRIITSFLPLVTSSNTEIEKAINDFLQRKSLA